MDLGQLEMIAHFVSLELLAGEIDLAALARHINPASLAGELTDGHMEKIAGELTDDQLSKIADEVDLHELIGKLDMDKLAENMAEELNLDHAIGEWFSNQSFDIRVS
jgi:hypothetical protein